MHQPVSKLPLYSTIRHRCAGTKAAAEDLITKGVVSGIFLSNTIYMFHKTAILIDGGFFVRRFKELYSHTPKIKDVQPFLDNTLDKVQKTTEVGKDVLFRTFYYDCQPYGEIQKDPNGRIIDFSSLPRYKAASLFQKELKMFPQMAIRFGELSFNGWKINPGSNKYIPDFKQKSVDIKMGLDIAWLATKKIVDKLVIVAGDSDFITPMKFARKEGLLIYLDCMKQSQIKLSLKEHADFLL